MTLGSATPFAVSAEGRPRRPSKADSLRPTYGFDDVSLAPGTETIDPADVSLDVDSRAADVDAYLEPGMRSQRADGFAISEDPTRAQGDTIGALYARLLERCRREAAG